jgi:hypothetical protein
MKPFLASVIFLAAMGADQKSLNLPPGQYPGNPAENFAPSLKRAGTGRQNLALRRPAYQSSSYDYVLTALSPSRTCMTSNRVSKWAAHCACGSTAGVVWRPAVTIGDSAAAPALMARVEPVGEKSGERLLPAIISDSYFILLPGESKTVIVEVAEADARGEPMAVEVDGFNVTPGR